MKAWHPARALKLVDCFVFVLKWSFSLCQFTLNTTSFNHIPPRTIPPSSRASPLPPTLTPYGEDHAQEEEDDDDKDDEEKGRRETWGESRVGGLVTGGRGGKGGTRGMDFSGSRVCGW